MTTKFHLAEYQPPTTAIIQRGFYPILKIHIFNQLDFLTE